MSVFVQGKSGLTKIAGLAQDIGVMAGATAVSDGAEGIVPAPKAGDQNKFLRANGTWGDIGEIFNTTYTLSKDAETGNIILTSSEGDVYSIVDNDTFHSFVKSGTKLVITSNAEGAEPQEIELGEVVTSTEVSSWNGKAEISDIPTQLSELADDADNRLVTDAEKSAWNAKAEVSDIPTKASDIAAVATTSVGVAGGVASLDENGLVPSSQLPSYVDDVLEYASTSSFPAQGESGKIYIAFDTEKTYRWTGTQYGVISETLALGETSATAYAGDKGKALADTVAGLHAVAFSGDYNDLINKPEASDVKLSNGTTIETAISDINDSLATKLSSASISGTTLVIG